MTAEEKYESALNRLVSANDEINRLERSLSALKGKLAAAETGLRNISQAKWPLRLLLDVTTAHVSQKTGNMLDEWGASCARSETTVPNVALTGYGWLVSVVDPDDEPGKSLPDDLRAVIAEARKRKAEFILFDRDGDAVPDLPLYDW